MMLSPLSLLKMRANSSLLLLSRMTNGCPPPVLQQQHHQFYHSSSSHSLSFSNSILRLSSLSPSLSPPLSPPLFSSSFSSPFSSSSSSPFSSSSSSLLYFPQTNISKKETILKRYSSSKTPPNPAMEEREKQLFVSLLPQKPRKEEMEEEEGIGGFLSKMKNGFGLLGTCMYWKTWNYLQHRTPTYRQKVLARRLSHELFSCWPLVAVWMVPFAGNFFALFLVVYFAARAPHRLPRFFWSQSFYAQRRSQQWSILLEKKKKLLDFLQVYLEQSSFTEAEKDQVLQTLTKLNEGEVPTPEHLVPLIDIIQDLCSQKDLKKLKPFKKAIQTEGWILTETDYTLSKENSNRLGPGDILLACEEHGIWSGDQNLAGKSEIEIQQHLPYYDNKEQVEEMTTRLEQWVQISEALLSDRTLEEARKDQKFLMSYLFLLLIYGPY